MPELLPDSTKNLPGRARLEEAAAITLFAAGGVAVATGVVLIFLNQPRIVPQEEVAAIPAGKLTIVPQVGQEQASLTVGFRF